MALRNVVYLCKLIILCFAVYSANIRADIIYLHADLQGSIVAESNEAGKLNNSRHYSAYGEQLKSNKSGVGYTGHVYDNDLELIYMQARYYDPVIGRFYSNDPVGFTGEVDTFNRYSYVANNPYKYVDPDGQAKIYVETQGTGHVGITTNYKGNEVNYDFGRYKGRYSNSIYSGPGILKRTGGTPSSASYSGYKVFDLGVSQALDNEIAKGFRAAFDAGSASLPKDVMNSLASPSELSSTQRYSGSDWGLTGPNCVSHTFETLKSTLQGVRNPEAGFSKALQSEATNLYNKIDTFIFTPAGAKGALNENF
ncbi:RHS repeat-associated core domain-containing protein [Psychrobium sp. nBUS_13]|uniref:RHS repeat-associated core domain-containing protein n=1 Tax=Psychrobium sp. nBUS_13 TaxID=3395319 RepID=UPI003EBFC33F